MALNLTQVKICSVPVQKWTCFRWESSFDFPFSAHIYHIGSESEMDKHRFMFSYVLRLVLRTCIDLASIFLLPHMLDAPTAFLDYLQHLCTNIQSVEYEYQLKSTTQSYGQKWESIIMYQKESTMTLLFLPIHLLLCYLLIWTDSSKVLQFQQGNITSRRVDSRA